MSISSSSSSSSGSSSSVVVGRGSYGGLKPNPDTTLTCTPPDNDIISSIRSLASWKPHHSVLGITLITLGALCFSCMFLFVKLLKDTADTFTLAFYRALLILGFMIIVGICKMQMADDIVHETFAGEAEEFCFGVLGRTQCTSWRYN